MTFFINILLEAAALPSEGIDGEQLGSALITLHLILAAFAIMIALAQVPCATRRISAAVMPLSEVIDLSGDGIADVVGVDLDGNGTFDEFKLAGETEDPKACNPR